MDARPPETSAQAAARRLPATSSSWTEMESEDKFGAVLGSAALLVAPWPFLVMVVKLPSGWAWLPVGLVVYLILRAVYFSLRGGQSGIVVVDSAGTVRVFTGHFSVRRMSRMFDVGETVWTRHGLIGGVLLFLVVSAAFVLVGVLLGGGTVVVFVAAMGFWFLDLLRAVVMLMWCRWSTEYRLLDSIPMVALLGLYARSHGWRAAVSGVPADRLLETLRASPVHRSMAERYAELCDRIGRVVGPFL